MHQQHAADYVHLMVEVRISLPMGKTHQSHSARRYSHFSFFCYFSRHSVFHFWSFCRVLIFIHSSLLPLFLQVLQKICLANHIHRVVELLYSDAMQQMKVALLGSPAAKLLYIMWMSMQSTPSTQHQATPHQPQTDTKGPIDVTATLSGVETPTSPAQKEPTTS